jgi:hypothetical protein
METFKIVVRFRDRHINGYVQKFDDHYDVFFQDEEILQSMGGLISFDSKKQLKYAKATSADDASKFHKAIASQLQ